MLKKNGVDMALIRYINIFYNINNETQCLAHLYSGEMRLASGIIDQFKLRADQYSDDLKDYLMQPNEIWAYLTKDKTSWDKHIKPYFHKIKYTALMSDIQTLYERAGNLRTNFARLCLDKNPQRQILYSQRSVF
ncbi:MAG: hypothetical protein IPL33_06565 [Sphingobacteriales bacterium]|nr:hypothetical protein [Sphingobacteriales bacterium]